MPYPNFNFHSNGISNYPLSTWQTLLAQDQRIKKLQELGEELIKEQGENGKKKLIELIVPNERLSSIFRLSEHSPLIKSLFQEDKYQHLWENRLKKERLGYNNPEVETTTFDRLMGVYLGTEYKVWLMAGRFDESDAIQIGNEAAKRGVDTHRMLQIVLGQSTESDSLYHHTAPTA